MSVFALRPLKACFKETDIIKQENESDFRKAVLLCGYTYDHNFYGKLLKLRKNINYFLIIIKAQLETNDVLPFKKDILEMRHVVVRYMARNYIFELIKQAAQFNYNTHTTEKLSSIQPSVELLKKYGILASSSSSCDKQSSAIQLNANKYTHHTSLCGLTT